MEGRVSGMGPESNNGVDHGFPERDLKAMFRIDRFAGLQTDQTCRNRFGIENHFACFPRVGEAPTSGAIGATPLGGC